MISFQEARAAVSQVCPLGTQEIDVSNSLGRVLSEDVVSLVDSPPIDSSLKDGFALRAQDIETASYKRPIRLTVRGSLCAGAQASLSINESEAIKVMTGARLPDGANAVLPQELASEEGDSAVSCLAPTTEGRNILQKGSDISKGEVLLPKGVRLTPGLIGLLTGAGLTKVKVFSIPRVVIVATGSELAEEGRLNEAYKIFPSNRATIVSWLKGIGVEAKAMLCKDEPQALERLLSDCLENFDVIITSGGVLDGERDLVVKIFERLGVGFCFKRVRMGPGKGVCMGTLGKRLIFNLPGGPPSNFVAFLFVALSSVIRFIGITEPFPKVVKATLGNPLKGRSDWTQLVLAKLRFKGNAFYTFPVREESRLKRIAFSDSVIINPEGSTVLRAGQLVDVAVFQPSKVL